jgi:hypothetical protein
VILKEVRALVPVQVYITFPVNPVLTTFQVKVWYIELQVNIAAVGDQVNPKAARVPVQIVVQALLIKKISIWRLTLIHILI